MKRISLGIWFILLTIVVAVAWAKPNFVVINSVGEIDFSDYEKSWDDPRENLQPDVDVNVKLTESQVGRHLTVDEIEHIREVVIKKAATIKERKLTAYLANIPRTVVYRLGIQIPDDVDIRLSGPGALMLTFRGGDGKPIQVPDLAIVCILKHNPADKWATTYDGQVLLNNSFNKGAPADLPKVVLVCVSDAYYGMELLNVQPIEGKFTIEDHRTKITFQ
jgi:hypothetical protein